MSAVVDEKVQIREAGIEVTCLSMGRWGTKCYVVVDLQSSDAVVIDPGDDAERVIAFAQKYKVAHVVCTHGHYDHLGAAREVCEYFGLACQIHANDDRLATTLAPLYAKRFDGIDIVPPRAVRHVHDNANLLFGRHALKVISTPGHTPGSICLSLGAAVFTGDTLLHEQVGRTDLPGGNAATLAMSIARLLATTDDAAVLFPGHGQIWTAAAAKRWLQLTSR